MEQAATHPERRPSIVAFYLLALGVSWGAWAPWLARAGSAGSDGFGGYLHLLGGLGPCAAALLLTALTEGRAGLRGFARTTTTAQAARVALFWGLLFPGVLFVVSAQIMGLVNHSPVHWSRLGLAPEYPGLGRVQYVVASLVFYGIGEEVGWRGFLYPRLRRSGFQALAAALLVVPFWALWHLPIFFATESYRAMGPGAVVGWLLSLASGGVLTAWLYDRAKGSVLPAVVLHASLDVFFIADVGVPVQSAMGAAVTLWGIVAAVGQFRQRAR